MIVGFKNELTIFSEDRSLGWRTFKALPCGDGMKLSIQNSPGHYVKNHWGKPEAFDWDALDSWEIAVQGPFGGIEPFHAYLRYTELAEFREKPGVYNDAVLGFLSTEEVERILAFLRNLYGYAGED